MFMSYEYQGVKYYSIDQVKKQIHRLDCQETILLSMARSEDENYSEAERNALTMAVTRNQMDRCELLVIWNKLLRRNRRIKAVKSLFGKKA